MTAPASPLMRVLPDDPAYIAQAAAEAAYWAKPHPFGLESSEDRVDGDADVYNNERFTGRRDMHWEDLVRRYGPFRRALVLGTSALNIERRLLATNPKAHFTFLDISAGAVERRQRVLGAEFPGRVGTMTADLNFVTFEPGAYDLIVSAASLHHVTNLEYCAQQINDALSPGGYFFLCDYVGEKRFQFSDAKKAVYEAIYNRDVARTPGREGGLIWDDDSDLSPFCGLRSDEMLPVLRQYLDEVDVRTAGTLFVCLMRSHPAHLPPRPASLRTRVYRAVRWRVLRIIPRKPRHVQVSKRYLDELALVGETLADAGVLPAANAFAIYRKRIA